MSRFKEQKESINKLSKERIDICKQCPEFTDLKFCKKCGCIMPLKTRILKAKCPLGKW